jgi:hypothetical protein
MNLSTGQATCCAVLQPARSAVEALPLGRCIPKLRQISVAFGCLEPVKALRIAGTGRIDEERIASALRQQVIALGVASDAIAGKRLAIWRPVQPPPSDGEDPLMHHLVYLASTLIWINDTEVVGRSYEYEASQRNAKTRSVTPGVHTVNHSNAIAERQRRPGRPLG